MIITYFGIIVFQLISWIIPDIFTNVTCYEYRAGELAFSLPALSTRHEIPGELYLREECHD